MNTNLDATVRQMCLDGQSTVVEYLRQVGFDVKVHEAPLGNGETAVLIAIMDVRLDETGRIIDKASDMALLSMTPLGTD